MMGFGKRPFRLRAVFFVDISLLWETFIHC